MRHLLSKVIGRGSAAGSELPDIQPAPPAEPAGEPDWASIASHTELARQAGEWHSLSPERYFAGPVRRFLELASDPQVTARGRARVMEFARVSWGRYCDAAVERGADADALDSRARAAVIAHFEAGVPDGDYMIDVWEGLASHNWTAETPRSERT